MNIGKAAKLSDLTIKAVRYYANIGLVKPQQNTNKTLPMGSFLDSLVTIM